MSRRGEGRGLSYVLCVLCAEFLCASVLSILFVLTYRVTLLLPLFPNRFPLLLPHRYRVLASQSRVLRQRKDNPKFWRSNVLLLAEKADLPVLAFCRDVTKEGLLMIGACV